MGESTYLLALAGLLHDVGKFAVRAGARGTRTWDQDAQRDFGHYHALLTADFAGEYVPEAWRVPVKNAASNHHRPLGRADRILALADRLSSGERDPLAAEDRAAQPRQLLSIFCSVTADEMKAPGGAYWPLEPLRIDESVLFPGPPLPDEKVWQAYDGLWGVFRREASLLRDAHSDGGDLAAYVESMLLLLQRYTSCMPSAYYKSKPDISLYDHCRMTGALAAVLDGGGLSDEAMERLVRSTDSSEDVAMLVGGDLSGVQDFIYTITARGATSSLRGRSFYLQLLTEAAVRFVLRGLDLPSTNVIYTGGGNFYLLARPGDGERLLEIQRAISRVLHRHHQGDLYLALACRNLTARDFSGRRITVAWEALGGDLLRAKLRRFAELGPDLAGLFLPRGHGGNQDRQCQVCGAEHPLTEAIEREEAEPVRKCPACLGYEGLGEDLRRARFLVLDEIAPPPAVADEGAPEAGTWEDVLEGLGMRAAVYEKARDLPAEGKARRALLALDDAALEELGPGPRTSTGRRLLVNVTPILTGEEVGALKAKGVTGLPAPGATKPFDVLERHSEGIERLGVLRMDVDNLGRLFAEGLETPTLSRVAALSGAISLFFEGWAAELARRHNRDGGAEHDRVYSIYSGGDDLLFVGSWDAVVELARELRSDLGRYAAGHPGIHASAGIVLVGGKYPLAQAAQDAANAEEQAKSLRWFKDGQVRHKDAICFLGQALPWERFGLGPCGPGVGDAHALMHRLVALVGEGNGGAPQALIRQLTGLYAQ